MQTADIIDDLIARRDAEIERLRAALVSIGIINASGGRYDPEIDRVIRECADEQSALT